jgi:hypothetical protein
VSLPTPEEAFDTLEDDLECSDFSYHRIKVLEFIRARDAAVLNEVHERVKVEAEAHVKGAYGDVGVYNEGIGLEKAQRIIRSLAAELGKP